MLERNAAHADFLAQSPLRGVDGATTPMPARAHLEVSHLPPWDSPISLRAGCPCCRPGFPDQANGQGAWRSWPNPGSEAAVWGT